MQNIRVASVQFNHLPNNKRSNLEKIQYWVKKAHNEKVRLAVFPEMCITGYWHVRKLAKKDILALSEEVPDGPSTQELVQLSRKYGMSIGAGLIEQSDDGKLYNTYVVAMPDGQTQKHRKLHCFISEHMASGDSFTVFETPEGCCVGVLICYDCNIIENVRINALKGVEILLAPHQTGGCNSPSPRLMGLIDTKLWENRTQNPKAIEEEFLGPKGREWLMRWLPSRAHDNGIFLIFSNGVGIDDDEVRTGNSMILDPYGEILAETWRADDDMVVADLDADRLHMSLGQRLIQSRRPDLYGIIAVPTGKEQDTRKIRFPVNK
ncbi:MAG: nitrilase family protein [Spirochaetota bacterium]|nr:MAG: nitrilase family protein [Spirochaetota bacterium]